MTSVINTISNYLFKDNHQNNDNNSIEIKEIIINDDIILINNTKIPVPPVLPIDFLKEYKCNVRCKTKYVNFYQYQKELKKKQLKLDKKQNYRKKNKKKR